MHINFSPDYITCCCLLHNLLICRREMDVKQILILLDEEIASTQEFTTQEGAVAIEGGETFNEQ